MVFTEATTIISTSTAEAEYRATDELRWIRHIEKELGMLDLDVPTVLHVNNQSAIHMLKNISKENITKGKKHVDISRKFIPEHLGRTLDLNMYKFRPISWQTRKIFEELLSKVIKEECCD